MQLTGFDLIPTIMYNYYTYIYTFNYFIEINKVLL